MEKFQIGDLVWLSSACKEGLYHGPPAMVVASYVDVPRIFLFNDAANTHMLESEDLGAGRVYDILYNGEIEAGVLAEWLEPLGDWLEPLANRANGEGEDSSSPSDE